MTTVIQVATSQPTHSVKHTNRGLSAKRELPGASWRPSGSLCVAEEHQNTHPHCLHTWQRDTNTSDAWFTIFV